MDTSARRRMQITKMKVPSDNEGEGQGNGHNVIEILDVLDDVLDDGWRFGWRLRWRVTFGWHLFVNTVILYILHNDFCRERVISRFLMTSCHTPSLSSSILGSIIFFMPVPKLVHTTIFSETCRQLHSFYNICPGLTYLSGYLEGFERKNHRCPLLTTLMSGVRLQCILVYESVSHVASYCSPVRDLWCVHILSYLRVYLNSWVNSRWFLCLYFEIKFSHLSTKSYPLLTCLKNFLKTLSKT